MGITANLAFSLDLTFTGTKFSHVVAWAIEGTRHNGEWLAALLADTVDALVISFCVPDPHELRQHRIGALFGAIHPLGARWSMKHNSANRARNIVLDFVGRGYAKLGNACTFATAIMILLLASASNWHFLGFAAAGAVHSYAIAHGFITASAAAKFLVSVVGKNSKVLAALLALATFGELRGTHKRNLLSNGWHVCLGHAAPTGGIHNYIRLGANHQTRTCPKQLHYSTGVQGLLVA